MNFWQGKLQWEPQESNDTTDSQWGWEARGLIWMPLGYWGSGALSKRTSGLLRVMAGHPGDSKMPRADIHERMLAGRAMAQGKFISYLRVSTDKQDRSGLGIEAQHEPSQATSMVADGRSSPNTWKLKAAVLGPAEARCCTVTRQGGRSEAGICQAGPSDAQC
jgi:hypothetical protein